MPQLVAGRFQLLGVLGRGAFGQVLQARDQQLGVDVALKLLDRSRAVAELEARFVREARLTAGIRHPNVVGLLDCGVTDKGTPFIAYELVPGVDLATYLSTSGPPPPDTSLEWCLDLAGGLAAIHDAGVVHRDLKSPNILVPADGRSPLICDLGLARAQESGGEPALTRMGAIVGTPRYVAPECFQGQPQTEAADVFGLSAVLYEILHGEPWRRGETVEAAIDEAFEEEVPFEQHPRLGSSPMDRTLYLGLRKDPRLRLPHGVALWKAFEHHAESVGARPSRPPRPVPPATVISARGGLPADAARSGLSRSLGFLAGLLMTIAIGVAAVLLAPPPAPSPALRRLPDAPAHATEPLGP
jgi:serine/threonine-protein kinase